MRAKQVRIPSPDHPISIQHNPARVVVSVAGQVIADTRIALTLREADYVPVQYIPREDVDFSHLEQTDHATYCPYKGDCGYYSAPERSHSMRSGRMRIHIQPLRRSRGMSRFYPDRVDEIGEQLPTTRESSKSSHT